MATHSKIDLGVTASDTLTIQTGGTLNIVDAGGLQSNGTAITSLTTLAGITAGTAAASKALILDANKDIGDLRNLDAVNIDAGASGTAGTVDVFPTTAAKGKLAITAADSAGDTTTTIVNASQAGARTYTIPDAGAAANFALNLANEGHVKVAGVSFTEDGSGTSYTATVEIPAGAIVHDIGFVTTVLWDGTSASLDIGDDDDPNGWFAGVNLKATDLVVGEVLSITNSENWGGKQGVYLVAATGRKGRVTAGVDSGVYYGAASEVIFLVTPGAADGSAGRSFGWVCYSVPTFVASTNA